MQEGNTVNIMFVSELESDILEIKDYLSQSGSRSYAVEYCPTFNDATTLLNRQELIPDVIIVDLGLFVSVQTRDALRGMVKIAGNIPLIAFTERGDHATAVMAMEEGAADNIVKGHSLEDGSRLRDAVDFSMARAALIHMHDHEKQRLAEKNTAKTTDEIGSIRRAAVEALDLLKSEQAKLVEKMTEKNATDFDEAIGEISEALVRARFENVLLLGRLFVYQLFEYIFFHIGPLSKRPPRLLLAAGS